MSQSFPQLRDQLYVFVDESGNFDFNDTGTSHFVMASIMTTDPVLSSLPLQRLKYRLISRGHDVADFRASKDLKWVRNEVFKELEELQYCHFHTIFVRKSCLSDTLKRGNSIFRELAMEIAEAALQLSDALEVNRLVFVFDRAISLGGQSLVRESIVRLNRQPQRQLNVLFHPISTDFNGQVADYIAWAKFRQVEREDHEYWNFLKVSLRPTEIEVQ